MLWLHMVPSVAVFVHQELHIGCAMLQDLVLDLPALADCLAALPLHQLLGVEPQFLQELEQQQPLQQQPQQQQRQQQQQQQQQVASAKASQQAPHLTDRPVHAVPQAVPLPVAPPPIVPSPVSISWPQPSVASTPVLAAQQLPVAGPAQAALLRTPAAAASGTSADAFDSELDSLLQGSSAAAAPAAAATAPAGSAAHRATTSATPAIAASVPGSTPPQVLTPGVSPAPLPVYRPPIGMAPSALSSAAASAKGSGLPAGAAAAGEVDDELEELLGIAMRPTKVSQHQLPSVRAMSHVKPLADPACVHAVLRCVRRALPQHPPLQ